MRTTKTFLLFSVFCLGLCVSAVCLAQTDTTTNNTTADVSDVSATDLSATEPTILPDNPLYFLKEWGRGIQSIFAFGQLKKAELEQKFANERLLELKKMADEGKISSEIFQKATEKYEKAMERIKNATDKIKEKADTDPNVNKFLEKFTNQQVLHEKILEKLEGQVSADVLQKIKDAREQHLERFKEVMTKLQENKDEIAQKIKNALIDGDSNATEILDRIKEKMPDDIKEKVEAIKEEVREKVNTHLMDKSTQINEQKNCPALEKPAENFCKAGIIKAIRDANGCITNLECKTIELTKPTTSCQTNSDCQVIFSNCGCANTCILKSDIEVRVDCARECSTNESDLSVKSCMCQSGKCIPDTNNN